MTKPVILVLLLGCVGCAKVPVYQSEFQTHDFVLDGVGQDWPSKTYSDYRTGMIWGLSNDKKHLYITLQVTQPATSRKILMGGLTLFIDTLGKGSQQLCIDFPLARDVQSFLRSKRTSGTSPQSRKGMPDMSMNGIYLNEFFQSGMARMKLRGFEKGPSETMCRNLDAGGVNAMISIDSSEMLYCEYSIPLSLIFNHPNRYLMDSTQVFSYGFQTGEMQRPPAQAPTGKKGMRPGAGINSQGRTRGRMGINPGRMNPGQDMPTPVKVVVKKASLSLL